MKLQWLLDTNTCIAIMNQHPEHVRHTLMQHPVESVGMSVISLYELEYGVSKSKMKAQNRKTLDGFKTYIQTFPWIEDCACFSAEIRTDLEKKGTLIGPHDILIAAHALTLGATLETHNTKEFKRVKHLHLVDWE
jgi:tRNA(fMet)-specific endonuclease VapC